MKLKLNIMTTEELSELLHILYHRLSMTPAEKRLAESIVLILQKRVDDLLVKG